jgi:alpha-glucosidase (family GH31 glycosyl hydrolase)
MNKIIITLFVCITFVVSVYPQKYNSVADPKAVVQSGNARFTILTPRTIRMEWSEDGKFEDRASLTFVNRKLPVPKFTKSEKDGWIEISTDELKLKYKTGEMFNGNNLLVEFKLGTELKTWKFGQENKGNLLGTRRTLDGTDGEYRDPSKPETKLKLEDGMISREGWCVVDDAQKSLFDNSEWPWVIARPAKKFQDLYFFGYGYNYKQAMKDFTEVAGKIALPPKFIFGYWYSRYWPYTQKEVTEIIGTFESLNIPLDVFVIDMDWHLTIEKEFFKDGKRINDQAGQNIAWTGFTWDKNFFPYPDDLLSWKKDKNLKMCLNIHPASGIQPHEEKYTQMAKAMGIDPATKKYVPFDITNKEYAKNYFDIVLHPMEKMGIDFWWLDWQQWSTTTIPGVNPTFYLNYVHYSDMERRNQVRPFIYHRWGGLGNHRYQIGFSGDTKISWASLDYQPYFTTTAANVGFGFWGHDIGGHHLNQDNDPELLTRWFQFGVFSPLLKTHATHDDGIKRKIWEYPSEYFFIMRDLIDLRYALVPYIYTAARKSYDEGISLCKPLYYEYPQKDEAYKIRNEYFFGDDMIVNPVTKPIGKDSLFAYQTTWLPEGKWYEWATGTTLNGGATIKRAFTIDEIPIYVREGAVVPTQPKVKNLSEKVDRIILNLFPGSKGTGRIYEDEGNNQNFKNGKYAVTKITQERKGDKLIVTVFPAEGNYPGMVRNRNYELRIINSLPLVSVKLNGREISYNKELKSSSWNYNGDKLTANILTAKESVTRKLVFEITTSKEDASLLSGKEGQLKRLYSFTKFLAGTKRFWDQTNWNDGVTNSGIIVKAAQTGILIEKTPKSAAELLKKFETDRKEILGMLNDVQKTRPMFKPYYELLINN